MAIRISAGRVNSTKRIRNSDKFLEEEDQVLDGFLGGAFGCPRTDLDRLGAFLGDQADADG